MTVAAPRFTFDLPLDRAAAEPPEARGLVRDGVRLLVAGPDRLEHVAFAALTDQLDPGDVLVVNTSATLPAAVDGRRDDGRAVVVHWSTEIAESQWVVELRRPGVGGGATTGPTRDGHFGDVVALPDGSALTLAAPYPDESQDASRLWLARRDGRGSVLSMLRSHGRPVRYSYVTRDWPLSVYRSVFADEPGSAEMASAARPFTPTLVSRLRVAGIGILPVVLHTGVSSQEDGEPPYPERYRVAASTAAAANSTRAAGGRVLAVGTTVARALETVTDEESVVHSGEGWTDLVLGPDRPVRLLDGIITGWHSPGTSHLELLDAVVGQDMVRRAYSAALAGDYTWHEFGDSALLLRR